MRLFFQRLAKFPHFLVLFFKDLYSYYKNHRWEKFEGWGLHIYCGKFGAGKTCTMVRDCYNLCTKYKGLTVITNLKLVGFPEDVVIKPLGTINDILEAPDNTIVLIDEIGTIFNSRDFMGNKENCLPKILFQHICQCRHRFLMIMGTVQRWGFLDKQLRDITSDVTICSTFAPHPFSRMVTNRCYDASEYDMFYQSPLRPLQPLSTEVWIQTDFFRNLYDTKEMVSTMLTQTYISDDEINRNRAFEDIGIPLTPMDKKAEKRYKSNTKLR
ncbi:MAG: hypothetical protein ACI4KA_00140 [Oscillospiraceae bacterium]